MSKLWRMAAVCTVAGSLLGAGVPAAFATTTAAVPKITIAASAKLKVGGDAIVVYHSANSSYTQATISGAITGASTSNVVKLYAQPFPYKHPAKFVASATAGTTYSFKVKPTIATRYYAALEVSPTPINSATTTVYLTSGARVTTKRDCASGPVCRPQYRLYVFLPAALVKGYASKHWYTYLGVSRSTTSKYPPWPKWLYLDKKATVSRPRRITAIEYERTVGLAFWVGNDSVRWSFQVCAQDSEARNGVGLPGRHGCGIHRVSARVAYLG